MDPMAFKPGKSYKTISEVNVCFYDKDDCLMPDGVDLPVGTVLTYVGPDKESGHVFENADGTKYCLHDDDLAKIEELNTLN